MKSIRIDDFGTLCRQLDRYRHGKKLDLAEFNHLARLAWLGKVVMQPLDPEDKDCESWLTYVDYPDPLANHILEPDLELLGHMHLLDGEQGNALVQILRQGVEERAAVLKQLRERDFHSPYFYTSAEGGVADGE